VSPPLPSYNTPHLAQQHFRLTKTQHDTLPATLFTTFNMSLALSNLHHSTLDYHIRNSLHQLHIDPLVDPLPHMVTLPHESRKRAYRNIPRTTISTLWRMDLLNQAPLHLPHNNCRKASYIHIARDDLQRRDLFKPAQYLGSHLDQLPLLRLRIQATSYIPSHLHLANDHTYTPYDQRYCPSCLPIQMVGNALHTRLHCHTPHSTPAYTPHPLTLSPLFPPHSSPLSHPAILSPTRALRRKDLCSWSSHTPLQQTAMLLGSSPPKLLCKAWTHSTSTTCTQLIYSLQSHFSKHQSSASPGPVPSLTSSPASPPSDDTQCQVCQSPFDEEKRFSVTYVTPVGIWTASSPPSPPSHLGYGNVPCVPLLLLPPHPRVHCDTFASPLPSWTLTLTKHHLEKGKKKNPAIPCQYKEGGGADISGRKNNKMPRMRRWRAYDEGSGFKLHV